MVMVAASVFEPLTEGLGNLSLLLFWLNPLSIAEISEVGKSSKSYIYQVKYTILHHFKIP